MRTAILGLALLVMAAWEPMTEKSGTASAPAALPAGVPPGAISVGDDLYMVPAGMLEGCPSFRPFSPGKMVAQVIQYRHRSGGFTANRADADCTPR